MGTRVLIAVLSVALAATACSQGPAPKPPAATSEVAPPPVVSPLGSSDPMELRIERIGVRSSLVALGLDPQGVVQMPPVNEGMQAGWHRLHPKQWIIVGRIESNEARGVFYRLNDLRQGDVVEVSKKDGSLARFTVGRTERIIRDDFFAEAVARDEKEEGLRLITCGTRDNVIVHAVPAQ
ncbi:sortase domain-containing protein [Lentzea xinjiangensis]|uniref:sortase domain-containing protein n=1 Tax=Lentzea xinjiangensis TaxID=402600 RepID=UPI0015A62354|nr:sortase [Lentzea xinjiangensis]